MTTYYTIEMSKHIYDLIYDYLLEQLTMLDADDIVQLVHILDGWNEQIIKQDVKSNKDLLEEIKEQKFFDVLCEKYPDMKEELKDLRLKFLQGDFNEGNDK